jgi:flavodoxin
MISIIFFDWNCAELYTGWEKEEAGNMKALILYRSHYGNTKAVAEAMAEEIKKSGHEAEVRDLRKRLPDLREIGCVLIGAPTRLARVTWKAKRALKRLQRKGFVKPVAVFDTYGPVPTDPEKLQEDKKWFYPGAEGLLRLKAQALGLHVFEGILRCAVKEAKGPLQEGEAAKAAKFAREFVAQAAK